MYYDSKIGDNNQEIASLFKIFFESVYTPTNNNINFNMFDETEFDCED